jgi:hypothetical protein
MFPALDCQSNILEKYDSWIRNEDDVANHANLISKSRALIKVLLSVQRDNEKPDDGLEFGGSDEDCRTLSIKNS